jgi:hypothetical protein
MAKIDLRTWMYLGRRDKTEVRIITSVLCKYMLPISITNVSQINLPLLWQEEINQIIEQNKLLWDFWLYQAVDYRTLRYELKTRGYSNVPPSSTPEYKRNFVSGYVINNNKLLKQKIMTAKKFLS